MWLAAKMIHTLFESIIGNKVLEERLQKAAGKKHQKVRQDQQAASSSVSASASKPPEAPPKRKFDDMDIGLTNGGPTPPVSYERSRPQTPAATPSRDLGHGPSSSAAHASPKPHNASHERSAGASQHATSHTRPTTPFNGHLSMPATPPDLFLVTRTSPNLSPLLWENFQPDQLFPNGSEAFPDLTAGTPPSAIDPQLNMSEQTPTHGMPIPVMMDQPQHIAPHSMDNNRGSPDLVMSGLHPTPLGNSQQPHHPQQQQEENPHVFGLEGQPGWGVHDLDTTMGGAGPEGGSQDDSWSSSSRGAPTAPTTLNVEDW